MRILIFSEAFPPETKSASTLFFELAESLVKKGHQVSVITRMPRYNVAEGADLNNVPARELMSGVEVYRYNIPLLARHIPFIRGFEHFLIGLIFFWAGLKIKNIDIILVYSPPLPLGITGYWLGRLKKKPVLVNIQDLYPQTVIDLGLLNNKLLIKVSRMMESFIYRKSDHLTVHSEGNREYLISKGTKPASVTVVHNWVDTELIKPAEKDNEFSRKFGLAGKFVVSFAGVMGFAQGLDTVISAAELLWNKKDILFVLVGDGVKRPELEEKVKRLSLSNVVFVPTQPRDKYPQVLHASDVGLVTLSQDLLTPVVPGKLLSIIAAGKPVVASIPLSGDAPKIINEHKCGICVEAEQPALLAEAIDRLYNNRALCEEIGQNGRKAAVAVFSREACVSHYEEILSDLVKRG